MDPNFGLRYFKESQHEDVLKRVKANLVYLSPKSSTIEKKDEPSQNASTIPSKSIYIAYDHQEQSSKSLDEYDNLINEYRSKLNQIKQPVNSLDFWRENSVRWPLLGDLAKAMLGVPASSAQCERMFSIAGHIFNIKRRRTGIRVFEKLVFLKLNEDLF